MEASYLDSLRTQLHETEIEFEQARSQMYRCDGAIQILQHLIADAEKPAEQAETPEIPALA